MNKANALALNIPFVLVLKLSINHFPAFRFESLFKIIYWNRLSKPNDPDKKIHSYKPFYYICVLFRGKKFNST